MQLPTLNDRTFIHRLCSPKRTKGTQRPGLGSGCGSVDRAVAFNTRGLRFDSSHRQKFIEHLFIINCIEKTKINKKRPGMAHFLKKTRSWSTHFIINTVLTFLSAAVAAAASALASSSSQAKCCIRERKEMIKKRIFSL